MVKAILAGNKTQTRRIVKPQPKGDIHSIECGRVDDFDGKPIFGFCGESETWQSPYGGDGDRLWVRETWATSVACDDRPPSDMEKPGRGYGWPVWYATDGVVNTRRADPVPQGGPGFTTMGKCRPSIFMPRWASRINLEITAVRVERLQSINEADAMAEGIATDSRMEPMHGGATFRSAKLAYKSLWKSINGKGSWDANPWVWVVAFKKVFNGGADLPRK